LFKSLETALKLKNSSISRKETLKIDIMMRSNNKIVRRSRTLCYSAKTRKKRNLKTGKRRTGRSKRKFKEEPPPSTNGKTHGKEMHNKPLTGKTFIVLLLKCLKTWEETIFLEVLRLHPTRYSRKIMHKT